MNATLPGTTFIVCRVLLLATIVSALWMVNCQGPLSIELEAKSAPVPALRGCDLAQLPLFLSGNSATLDAFNLTKDDCLEIRGAQYRDFVFIGCYALAYLALAALLGERPHGLFKKLALITAFLSLAAAFSDFMEDRYALDIMRSLAATAATGADFVDVQAAASHGLTDGMISALRGWSLAKWALGFLVNGALSVIFWQNRWTWPKVCALLLSVSGAVGLLGVLVEIVAPHATYGPMLIVNGFFGGLAGGFVATLLFLTRKDDASLRNEEPAAAAPADDGGTSAPMER